MCTPYVGNDSMDCSGLSTLNYSREQFKRNYQVSLKKRAWDDHLTSPVGFKSGTIKNKMTNRQVTNRQVVIVLDDDEDEEENKTSDNTVHVSSEEGNSCNNRLPSLNLDKELSMKAGEKGSNEMNVNYSKDFNDWFNKKLNSAPWTNNIVKPAPLGKNGTFVLTSVKGSDNATSRSVLENCLMTPISQNFNTDGNFSSLVNQSNVSLGSSINLTSSLRSKNLVIIGDKLRQEGEHSKGNFVVNETVTSCPSFNQVQDSLLMKSLLSNNSSSLNMLESRPFLNVTNMGMQQPIIPRPIAINVQIPASSNERVAIVEVPASTGHPSGGFQPMDSVGGHQIVIVPSSNNQSRGGIVLNSPNNPLVQQPHLMASNSNPSKIFVVQSMAEPSRPNPTITTSQTTSYSNIFKSSLQNNPSNILSCPIPEQRTINNLTNNYSVAPNSIQITGGYNEVRCKVVSNVSTSTTNVPGLGSYRQSSIQCGTNIQRLDSNINQSGPLTPSIPFQSTRGTPVGISFDPVTSQAKLVCVTDAGYSSSSLLSSQSCQTDSNQSTGTSPTDAFVASKLLQALESGILKPLCNIDSSKISWKVVDKNKSDKKVADEVDKDVVVIDDSSDEEKDRHETLPQSTSCISNSLQDSSSITIPTSSPLFQSPSVSKFVPIAPKIVAGTISNESAASKDALSNVSNANNQTRNTVITTSSKPEPEISENESDPTLSKLNYFKEENQCNEESDLTSFGHRHKRQKLSLQEGTSSQEESNLEVDCNLIPYTVKQDITSIKLDCDDIKDDTEHDYNHSLNQTNLEAKRDEIPNVFKEELSITKLDYDDNKDMSNDDGDVRNVKSEDLKYNPSCSNVDETGTIGSGDNMNHDQKDSLCVDVKPFACSYCGFRVAIESNLEMHVKAFHVGKKAKSMPLLNKNNNPSKKINALVVKTQMFRCFVCDFCTYRSSNFNIHLMSEHDIYSCNKCSFMVDNSDELRSHESIHKKAGKIYSKLSLEVLKDESNDGNDSPLEIKCILCDFETPSQTKMIEHTLSSHIDQTAKSYECGKCEFNCKEECEMSRHKMTHTDRCRFPCDSCGFRASSQDSLVKHKKQIHPQKDTIFCCYCDFSSDTHAELREHKHSAHPSKYPFVCKKCDFRTSKDSILDRHLKLYHGTNSNEPSTLKDNEKSNSSDSTTSVIGQCLPKPVQSNTYQCNICSFSAFSENGLKNHMAAHDSLEEKVELGKYKCSFCKFKSDKLAVLNKHRYESHLNEHPYSCKKCIFRTTIPYRLMRHEKNVHNIKRKHYELHECSICEFRTSEPSLLAQHKNHAHSSKFNFKCSHCQYCTNSASHFMKHCKTVHRNKISRNIKETEKKQNTTDCTSGSSESVDDINESGSTAVNETRESESSALLYYCDVCDYKTKCCVEFEKHKVSQHCKYAECEQCPFIADSLDRLHCHRFKVHPSVYLHKCAYCNFSHCSKQTVSIHTEMHNTKVCYYCEFKTMSFQLLDLHIQKVHPEKQLEKCDLCGYTTTCSSLFATHISKLHAILKCTVCSFFTHSQYEIFKHKYTHHPHLLPYACHECGFRAEDSVSMAHHKSEVHNVQCCKCPFVAPTSEKLNIHTYVEHTSDYYLKCLFCNYFAENPEDLYKHELILHCKTIYRCTRCFFFVDRKDLFLTHILTCHPKCISSVMSDAVPVSRKVCGYCDFSTLSSTSLYKHFGSCHSSDYPWKCDKCCYRSKLKSRLTDHVRMNHVDRGQFKACQFCDFRAEKILDVRSHEFSIHSKEFPFSCDLCSYRAKRTDSLARHKKRWHLTKRKR